MDYLQDCQISRIKNFSQGALMSNIFWWIRQIVLISISGFFLYFGIRLLVSAYKLNDPFTFLMTFFASNFIILISAALMIGFAYRMITTYRQARNSDSAAGPDKSE